jgi:hypothetical protein
MKELRLSGGERFVVDWVESGGSGRCMMPLPAPVLSGPTPAWLR